MLDSNDKPPRCQRSARASTLDGGACRGVSWGGGGFGVPLLLSFFFAQPFGFLLLLLHHIPLAPLKIVVHASHDDWEPRFSRFACRFSFMVACAFFFTFFFALRPLLMPHPFMLASSAIFYDTRTPPPPSDSFHTSSHNALQDYVRRPKLTLIA